MHSVTIKKMDHIIYPKTCHDNLLLQSLQSVGIKLPLLPFRNIFIVIGSNIGSLHKKLTRVFDLQITSVDQVCQNLCKIVGLTLMLVSGCAMFTCMHLLNRLSPSSQRNQACTTHAHAHVHMAGNINEQHTLSGERYVSDTKYIRNKTRKTHLHNKLLIYSIILPTTAHT